MVVPAAVLVLLPKCPLCLVGYAALLGIGISFEVASVVRGALLITCIVMLAMVSARALTRDR